MSEPEELEQPHAGRFHLRRLERYHGPVSAEARCERHRCGPIALIRNGDLITIDATTNEISIDLSDEDVAVRRNQWRMPPYKATRGTLGKYIRIVKSASLGCVTDE
jgi:dihydroxy-acid dehydratase